MRVFTIPTVPLRSQARRGNVTCFGSYLICNLILEIEFGKQI